MDKKFGEILAEAKANAKTGHVGHYGVARDLHKFIGKSPADVHKHLEAAKKKHGYEGHTVEAHKSDKHRESAAFSVGPAQEHDKHTLTHPDGHKEEVYVSHHAGKVTRIGHHTTTQPGKHHIHIHGKSLSYKNGDKKATYHHTSTGMHIEYH